MMRVWAMTITCDNTTDATVIKRKRTEVFGDEYYRITLIFV
jgi:hypothetical protein